MSTYSLCLHNMGFCYKIVSGAFLSVFVVFKRLENTMQDLHLSLERFDGPLSLLLHLIEKNDIDIYDIEISVITDQFLEYLELAKKNRIELATEFVLMASNLLEIKARMLLPNEQSAYKDVLLISEEDPRFDLMQRLIEYKQFKQLSEEMALLYEKYEGRRFKDKKSMPMMKNDSLDMEGVDASILAALYRKLLLKMPLEDDTRKGFFESIERESINLEQRTEDIIVYMKQSKKARFTDLIQDLRSAEELIVSFMSILNLMKDKVINAIQNEQYGDIDLEYVGVS